MIESTGRWIRHSINRFVDAFGFHVFLLRETFFFLRNRRIRLHVILMQILFTGVEALLITSLMSFGLGAVVVIQGYQLPNFLSGDLLYRILIIVITRELGPLLTAFIVIARSGSAITTELGNMIISHEMEAYLSVGIHPVSQLGVPRMIGVIFSMMILTIYFNVFGLLGSLTVSSILTQVHMADHLIGIFANLYLVDIVSSTVKSLVFGFIIASTAIYYGFSVNFAITEVPVKTILSIGMSIILCIFADAIIIRLTSFWSV